MSEPTRTSRAPAEKRLTYQQWKRRKMLRLARNWVLFLAGCAAVVALLTGGILWLLPKVHGLLAGPKVFAASVYDGTDYVFNAADARLTLVNANLPYTAEPAPLLDTADEVTGQQLEAEAAMQYRSMAAAALAFSEDIFPFMGMLTRKSQFSATSRLMPSPSEPMTMAAGPLRSALYRSVEAPAAVPKIQTPCFFRSFRTEVRLATRATGR